MYFIQIRHHLKITITLSFKLPRAENGLFRAQWLFQQPFNPLTAGAAYIRVFIFLLAH